MRVLLGIVTHNRSRLLRRALDSAFEQKIENLDLEVLDDASTDDTAEVQKYFPNVKWTKNAVREGYLTGRELWLRRGNYDYFCSLDDDAWFLSPGILFQGLKQMELHPKLAALAFDIVSPGRGEVTKQTASFQPASTFIGCGHLLRIAAARSVGGYQRYPGWYGVEEKDLCLRLLDKGWEVQHGYGLYVWHEKSLSARDLLSQHRSGVCNDLSFALKRFPFPTVVWGLPYKLISHLVFASRKGLLKTAWAGLGLFLKNFFLILQSRQPVKMGALREFLRRQRAEMILSNPDNQR